jgi:hypothetical protein
MLINRSNNILRALITKPFKTLYIFLFQSK